MRFLVHQLLEKSFNERSERTAILQGGRCFTYADVQRLSLQFEQHFENLGLKKGDHIGLVSRVRFEVIACMIAALRRGLVYIPLNIHAPASWIEKVAEAANIRHFIVDPPFVDRIEQIHSEKPNVVTVLGNVFGYAQDISYVANLEKTVLPAVNNLADDLAYILYTSGSTGHPKGIMLTHRNAVTFIEWMCLEFKVNESDRILSRAPLQFDLSVFDIFSTFSSGGTLVIADLEKDHSAEDVVELMRAQEITIVYTVPSAYISFLTRGRLERGIPTLRTLLYAGEPFPTPYLRRVMECLPGTMVSNIYGPTETNIVTYYHMHAPPQGDEAVPIGKVVMDTEAYIVDENLKLVADGEVGEILIRGGTVFVGYFNDAELTSKRLIQSPFHKYPTLLCRTGDYGRRLADGNIAYHGRMDNMVKTRGYRVEIGEVEAAISAFQGVDEVAVVTQPHEKYGNTLHAFIAFSNDGQSGQNVDGLKQFVETKIPNYMVPFDFIAMDVLPKTATGKVDRVRLKEILQRKVS